MTCYFPIKGFYPCHADSHTLGTKPTQLWKPSHLLNYSSHFSQLFTHVRLVPLSPIYYAYQFYNTPHFVDINIVLIIIFLRCIPIITPPPSRRGHGTTGCLCTRRVRQCIVINSDTSRTHLKQWPRGSSVLDNLLPFKHLPPSIHNNPDLGMCRVRF